jgi:ATP-dependent DNA helicase RecG
MALPININDLIQGQVIEWERLEFKKGWNPEKVLRTICAYANDINNWGGGYVIIGVEEINGVSQFPPVGIPKNQLDRIQGELVRICYQIQPNYLPVSQPYLIAGKHILIIWVPAGDLRPYSCPSTLGSDARRQYFIRSGSRTILARGENQSRLIELTARIPFDDRINQNTNINDLDLGLIREYLQVIGSDLFDESIQIPFAELCRQMQIARGPVEFLRPVNIGLLFFNKAPHLFFNRAWIELAIHDDDSGRNFKTETFTGPLHHQIRNCMAYLKREVIRSETRKVSGKPESITFSNYPYNALEEAIVNAVFHKSYADQQPIEVQVFPDSITVLSYPGPMPPITNDDLKKRQVVARGYRNRRIGDILKELDLTEGKSTGFPMIRDAMKKNNNPEATFFTDDVNTLFLVTLPCHPELKGTKSGTKWVPSQEVYTILNTSNLLDIEKFINALPNDERYQVNIQINEYINSLDGKHQLYRLFKILRILKKPLDRKEIFKKLELANKTDHYNKYLRPLLNVGWIEWTIPEKPTSRLQKYRLTDKGRKLLE